MKNEYKPIKYSNKELRDKVGIYQIRNIINEKIYIGSSTNLLKRKVSHFSLLKNNKHHSQKLQNAFNKYGKQNFVFEIIEFVKDKNNLLNREQYWIDKFDLSKNGYNINSNAQNRLGVKLSNETKNKISKSHKGIHAGKNNPMYGKHHSKETRLKMSRNRKPISDKTRKKLSILASKRVGELNPFYNKKHTEETKQKIKKVRGKHVVKIYPYYEYYDSFLEAGIKNNISKTSVRNSCKNNVYTKGMKFMEYKDYLKQNNIDTSN